MIPFGLGLDKYIRVFRVWGEELGKQGKWGELNKGEVFLLIDLGREDRLGLGRRRPCPSWRKWLFF